MAYAATRVGCCAERIMSICNSHHVTTFSVRLFADRSCRIRIGVDMSNPHNLGRWDPKANVFPYVLGKVLKTRQ